MSSRVIARLEAALSGLAGAPVKLARPNDPEHGDYATNVALRVAPERRRPPRELAGELAEAAARLPEVERAEAADARVDHGYARALPHPLRLLCAAERARKSDRRATRRAADLRARGSDLAPLERVRRRAGSRDHPLARARRPPDLPGRRHRLP